MFRLPSDKTVLFIFKKEGGISISHDEERNYLLLTMIQSHQTHGFQCVDLVHCHEAYFSYTRFIF